VSQEQIAKRLKNSEKKSGKKIGNGIYYEIEEARAITHAKIEERYACYNRRASNR